MKSKLIFGFATILLVLLNALALAQDPGQPDTLFIDCTPQNQFGAPESKVRFDLIFKTDNIGAGNDVTGIGWRLHITVTNNIKAKVVLDTTVAATYTETAVSSFNVKTTFVPSAGGDPKVFPLTYFLGMVKFSGTGLLAGTHNLAHFVLTVQDTCTISIDTSGCEACDPASFTTSNVSSYLPIWREGICQVTPYQNQSGPICHSPDSIPELSGSKVSFQVTALDPDTVGCYLISNCSFDILENPASETSATFTGPCSGSFTNMDFNWQTSPTDSGVYHIVFTFRDTCAGVESCTTLVNLFPNCILTRIGEAIGCAGSKVALPIEIESPLIDVGGFSLCIEYDPILMTFISLERGEFFDVPGPLQGSYQWNYLVWRNQPSTVIHKFELCIVGIGQFYYYGGTCLPRGGKGVLYIHFRLANNSLFGCFRSPMVWKRLDTNCMLNSFSDCSGNTVYVFDDTLFYNPRSCDPEKLYPKQTISNCAKSLDGGITFRCDCNWFGIGDININGFANEIGDAVLFANYFIYGIDVFDLDPEVRERQIFATDVNHDGITLTVADLVYLLRILSGDAVPLGQAPKISPNINTADLIFDGHIARVSTPVDLGAMYFVFKGEASDVKLLTSGLDLKWAASDDQTKVLLYGLKKDAKIPAGSTQLLKVSGNVELEKVEAAEYMGTPVNVESKNMITVPSNFNLSQNYPNPFNNATLIKFALAKDSEISLKIYNVAGQLVKEFKEYKSAGYHSISWDGTGSNGEKVASGVYLYRLQAGEFIQIKKMTLLK